MTAPDLLCLAFVGVILLADHFVSWQAFLRRSRVDPTRARLWIYRVLITEMWALVAAVVSLWLYQRRSWTLLRLDLPSGWRLWTSLVLIVAVTAYLAASIMKIVRLRRRGRVKIKSQTTIFAPHTTPELAWWSVVSVSAGWSEELIFRGFLIWAFQPIVGLWGAAALSVVVFGAAHAYQGATGVVATGVVGAILTLVVLIFGSLWPAIVLHMAIDLQQGIAAWLVLQNAPADPVVPATPSAQLST